MKRASAILVVVMGFASSIAHAGVGHVDMAAMAEARFSGERVMVPAIVKGDAELVFLVKKRLVEMFGDAGLQIPYTIDPGTGEVQVFVKETGAWQPLILEPSSSPTE
jgi:hypothetical protein